MGRRPGTHGFTLLELMVVLVLIAIMSALIIPEMKGTFGDAVLRSTARKLIDVFHLASSQAITLNQPQRVHIDRKNGRYVLESKRSRGEATSPPIGELPGAHGELDRAIAIEILTPGDDNATPADEGPAFVSGEDLGKPLKDDVVTFYPDGTADAAQILLRDHEGFRLGLQVSPITARVRIIELKHE